MAENKSQSVESKLETTQQETQQNFGKFDEENLQSMEEREKEIYKNHPCNLRIRAFDRMLCNFYVEKGWIMEYERLDLLEELVSGSESRIDKILNGLLSSRLGMVFSPLIFKLSTRWSNKIDTTNDEEEMIAQARMSLLTNIVEKFK